MTPGFAIDCEYLTGVAVASDFARRDELEWPPHPSRLFSALVSSWAARGSSLEEREALLALESAGSPDVHFPASGDRDVADVYVPPNDFTLPRAMPKSDKAIASLATVAADPRGGRNARAFPATVLPSDSRVVTFAWPGATLGDRNAASLRGIASTVAYLGHSSSLVRLWLRTDASSREVGESRHHWRPNDDGTHLMRVPTGGRLDELERDFAAGARPTAGAYQRYGRVGRASPRSVFDWRWVTLRDAGGSAVPLEQFPYVAWVLRRALIGIIDDELSPLMTETERSDVMALVSGHAGTDGRILDPHMAIVPLANVGWSEHSTGRLMGVGLVLPDHPARRLAAEAVEAAITRAGVSRPDADTGNVFVLTLGSIGEWWLAPTADDPRQSLSPSRYTGAAKTWATATPIVLDRFPKRDGDAERTIARACAHIGLPEPISVQVSPFSSAAGVPPSRSTPGDRAREGAWRTRWRHKDEPIDRFAGRMLTHATITFEQRVRGPVLLGAGRYHGLGLMLPLRDGADV